MAVLLLSSLSAFATPMTLVSDTDDGCTTCTITNQSVSTYVSPTGLLSGASWVQTDSSWFVNTDYSVWEMDLTTNNLASTLTSLYVFFDDNLRIETNGTVLFDSLTAGISAGWSTVTDVFAITGSTYFAAGDTLDFYVSNSGGGATGVIWKGSVDTTAVPEPSMLIMLGLGLITLGFKRCKNANR